jgi:hypothetical protein
MTPAFTKAHPFQVFVTDADGSKQYHARFSNHKCAARTAADIDVRGTVTGPDHFHLSNQECRDIAAKYEQPLN